MGAIPAVGCFVGTVGDVDGFALGIAVGTAVGCSVGALGDGVGLELGDAVGLELGARELGDVDGHKVGDSVGVELGRISPPHSTLPSPAHTHVSGSTIRRVGRLVGNEEGEMLGDALGKLLNHSSFVVGLGVVLVGLALVGLELGLILVGLELGLTVGETLGMFSQQLIHDPSLCGQQWPVMPRSLHAL